MVVLEFSTFIGRFHPLIVHLPIGFLLLAIILEWYQQKKGHKDVHGFITYAWFLGALAAIFAAFCGWLLAAGGLYLEEDLFWHRWLGIALALVAIAGWWIKRKPDLVSRKLHQLLHSVVLLLLIVEGHLGANLTHGQNFMAEHAPAPLKNLLGNPEIKNTLPVLANQDSVELYTHMVYPILQAKCLPCHGSEEQRGGLNIEQNAFFAEGGENGPVLVSGVPAESELFKRITLPPSSSKYMPPTGEPVTYDEIKLLEWWILHGAEFNRPLADLDIPSGIKPVLWRLYGLDTTPRPWYETLVLPPLNPEELRNLTDIGFTVQALGLDNPLLDIRFEGDSLSIEILKQLDPVKEYVTWLNLADTNIQDNWLATLSQLPNLTRLQLENTGITDQGVALLTNLENLEALNVYGTLITDTSLAHLGKLPGLKRLYVWDTGVTLAAARKLQESNEQLEVILGSQSQ